MSVKLLTLFSDGACARTAVNVQAEADADCESERSASGSGSSSSEGNCTALELSGTTYYYTYTCVSDRFAAIEKQFGSQAYFGYDIFSDTDCATYDSSVVYLAVGTCQMGLSNESASATLNADGSAELDVYWNNEDCSSTPTEYAPTAANLSAAACFTYSDTTNGYVYFTSASLAAASGSTSESGSASASTPESGSASASTPESTAPSSSSSATTAADNGSSGIGTGAIIGIILGALVVLLLILVLFRQQRNRKRQFSATKNQDALLEDAYYRGKTRTSGSTVASTGAWVFANTDTGMWDDESIISWRVPREKVIVLSLISRGGFGEVYKGTYNTQDVAIKMLLPETRRSIKHVNAFLAEVKMMAALEHTRIVQFIGVAWDSFNDLCVMSEYMAGGDLRALLAHYESSNHPKGFDYDKVKIALHIAHALTYLHSLPQPVIHRDLKSKNVLLTPGLDAKLTDFGVSRERQDRTMTAGVGTSLWMAPEVMIGEKYDVAADMFSFGVLLSELDVHALPYSHAKENSNTGRKMPDAAILQMVAMGALQVEFSPGALTEVVELGKACVAVEPSERPAASKALYELQKVMQVLSSMSL